MQARQDRVNNPFVVIVDFAGNNLLIFQMSGILYVGPYVCIGWAFFTQGFIFGTL